LDDPLLPWVFVHLQPYHPLVISHTAYPDPCIDWESPAP
jgi:hypothetical protein